MNLGGHNATHGITPPICSLLPGLYTCWSTSLRLFFFFSTNASISTGRVYTLNFVFLLLPGHHFLVFLSVLLSMNG